MFSSKISTKVQGMDFGINHDEQLVILLIIQKKGNVLHIDNCHRDLGNIYGILILNELRLLPPFS